MQMVQVNSLNKQEDNRHIWLLWLTTQTDAQVCQFDCNIDLEQDATSCPCTSTGHCLETSNQNLPQFSSMDIVTPQQKSSVMHSCSPYWVSGIIESSIPSHRYNRISYILGCERAQQIGYIYFPRITLPKLI